MQRSVSAGLLDHPSAKDRGEGGQQRAWDQSVTAIQGRDVLHTGPVERQVEQAGEHIHAGEPAVQGACQNGLIVQHLDGDDRLVGLAFPEVEGHEADDGVGCQALPAVGRDW